jgi:hypothetical protein
LRKAYTNKWAGKPAFAWKHITDVALGFGPVEFISDLPNGRAHFVGSASGQVTLLKCHSSTHIAVEMEIQNPTSLKSALYHLIPESWNNTTTGTPAANWNQIYTWEEDLDPTKY